MPLRHIFMLKIHDARCWLDLHEVLPLSISPRSVQLCHRTDTTPELKPLGLVTVYG